VAEAWRNLTAVGAGPLAVTDNLNFGNPERPEIMASASAASPALRSLHGARLPGRVGKSRSTTRPTAARSCRPDIGAVACWTISRNRQRSHSRRGRGDPADRRDQGLARQSLICARFCEREAGAPPPVDLAAERANGDLVRALIAEGIASAAHDVSDGGPSGPLAEMAWPRAFGGRARSTRRCRAWFWFGEDQARYLVTSGRRRRAGHGARARRRACRHAARPDRRRRMTLDGERPILAQNCASASRLAAAISPAAPLDVEFVIAPFGSVRVEFRRKALRERLPWQWTRARSSD